MAALQKIRSTGPLLVILLGLGLFAFIAGDYFKVFDIFANNNRQTIGEIYGETYKYPEFQQDVEDLTTFVKFQKSIQGQNPELNSREQDNLRLQAWESYKRNTAINKEAKNAGLQVTDEDIQNALLAGQVQYRSIGMLARLFPNQQNGGFDLAQYQNFLKEFDSNISRFRSAGQGQAIEQFFQIRKLSEYALKQLKSEILESKLYSAMGIGAVSNKVNAKFEFENNHINRNAEIVSISYDSLGINGIKVDSKDIQAVYDSYKELFPNMTKTAELKILDYVVRPSDEDRESLKKEVEGISARLQNGEDASTVIGSSKSEIGYDGLYRSTKAFEQLQVKDVADNIASMQLGQVSPTQYNASANAMITYKLIGKKEAADSLEYTMLWAIADTPEKSAQLADSIKNALLNGASYATIAKKYNQNSDTAKINSAQYENGILKTDEAKFFNNLNTAPIGLNILTLNNMSAVVNIIKRSHIETKYDVAIVKCPLRFSKETFNDKLNKLNKFVAENKTLDLFTKNAGKNGFLVRNIPYAQNNLEIQSDLGGQDAKDAFKWVFDQAKAGDLSKIYECGNDHEHLLVIGVSQIYDGKYLPLENENVKTFCEQKAKQIKASELALDAVKNVKSIAEAKTQKHAFTLEQNNINFDWLNPLVISSINVPEPKLTGVIARTNKNGFTGPISGEGGIYFAQITNVFKSKEKFDVEKEMNKISSRIMNNIFTQSYYGPQEILLNQLIYKNGKENSFLYRF